MVVDPLSLVHGVDGLQSVVDVIIGSNYHLFDLDLLLDGVIQFLSLLLLSVLLLILSQKVGILLIHGVAVSAEFCVGLAYNDTERM